MATTPGTTALLAEGAVLVAKQMQASGTAAFPRHRASEESTLVVTEGRCTIRFDDREVSLGAGEAIVLAADEWHQVEPAPSFTAAHVMPKGIRFTFSA